MFLNINKDMLFQDPDVQFCDSIMKNLKKILPWDVQVKTTFSTKGTIMFSLTINDSEYNEAQLNRLRESAMIDLKQGRLKRSNISDKSTIFNLMLAKRDNRESYTFAIQSAYVGPLLCEIGLSFRVVAKYALWKCISESGWPSIDLARIEVVGIAEKRTIEAYEKAKKDPTTKLEFNVKNGNPYFKFIKDEKSSSSKEKNAFLDYFKFNKDKAKNNFLEKKGEGWGDIINKFIQSLNGRVYVLKYNTNVFPTEVNPHISKNIEKLNMEGGVLIAKVCSRESSYISEALQLAHKIKDRLDYNNKIMQIHKFQVKKET
ncbi:MULTISPECIES: hypothetical protein [Francisella]|uniref:Uncharacterized protein n=1 Tax=Francisella opportunistica TaxID=2016517 RepID=A0A345JTL8_9GAMM|nr:MULTISPECIES: hypothetical protein [Francisella]APC92463.1 hypothetical protein BBG19_1741 [Francisella sp. MA067296]AXH30664.1 hypothetical protein CGC43_08815 [Francisella opportunistica]AXH32306.1 hypothetical protein CGC44_08790 [Francisella opportunistica]AXH33954.1 hypothetical protein CGC45_08855 [Francisella opportunistica]